MLKVSILETSTGLMAGLEHVYEGFTKGEDMSSWGRTCADTKLIPQLAQGGFKEELSR
jgi:hypothetical protein